MIANKLPEREGPQLTHLHLDNRGFGMALGGSDYLSKKEVADMEWDICSNRKDEAV